MARLTFWTERTRDPNGGCMLTTLPVLHRRLLAVLLAAIVTVEATWLSTRVGDDNPTWWGVAGGLVLGLVVDAMLLRAGPSHRA